MASSRQAQGRVRPSVAPVGLDFCGRSLRHWQLHEHQVCMGRTWTPSEMIQHFGEDSLPGKAQAFHSLRRCHCHLQCCDAQWEPVSVCGLSQHFVSSFLLFVFRRLSAC